MRPILAAVVAIISLASANAAFADKALSYPQVKRDVKTDIYHGRKIDDPYRWLERMAAPETRAFVAQQERFLADYLRDDPAIAETRDALRRRIESLSGLNAYSPPVRTDSGYYYQRTTPGLFQSELYLQPDLASPARKLIDPQTEFGDNQRLAAVAPNRQGDLVAYGRVQGQSRWRELYIRNAENGSDLPDRLTGIHALGGPIAWRRDGRSFFYVRFAPPEPGKELQNNIGAASIFLHRIGTPQKDDLAVFERADRPDWLYTLAVTHDDDFLVIGVYEGGDIRTQVYLVPLAADGEQSAIPLIDNPDAIYTFLGAKGKTFWFHTTLDAPNGRIVSIDVGRPEREHWTEVVAEAADPIAGGSAVGGNAVSLVNDTLLAMYLKDSRPYLRAFDLQGRQKYEVDVPGVGTIWGGFSGRQDSDEVFYSYLSLIDPNVIYRLDAASGRSVVFKRTELPFDPSDYLTTHTFYESHDGTRVPIFVTHKRGFDLDGRNPAFMYAYGAYGWVAFPWYQPHIMAWLERGGVYALPGIRGGGEYGESWHQDGIRRKKQNAIDDYIAAAEWLIKSGYTSPGLRVANGGSASGALATAAVLQRPQLFGAAIIDIPALDLLRYEQLSVSRAWTDELGSVSDPDEFRALRAYSPYHNIRDGHCYPPTMIIVGEKDETVLPAHGYKFVAALQNAQGCNNPALLKIVRGAGHSHGTTPAQQAETWADTWAFLERAMRRVATPASYKSR